MEGLSRITDHIYRDAEAEASSLLSRAMEEVHAKNMHYQKIAEARRLQLISLGETQAAELISRSLSAAELESRKQLLSMRQELVSEVFAEVRKQLSELPHDAYLEFLIRQTVMASGTGTEELILNEEDRAAYGSALVANANLLLLEAGKPGALTLSQETRRIPGGFLLKSGPVETNCSWDALITSARDALTGKIARILFDAR